jgi:hypothetical protein
MSFKETYKLITESEVFRNFIKENPAAELCTGFFVVDFFSNDNKNSLDYKLNEKIFTFSLRDDKSIKFEEDKLMQTEKNQTPSLEKISPDIKVDLEDLRATAQIQALDNKISSKFNKIIAVLQKPSKDSKQIWNLTCMLDGLIILHIIIDPETGNVDKFERKSMMDMIRKK